MQNLVVKSEIEGVIKTSTGKINVLDTQKKMGDLHVHVGKVSKGFNKSG
jgi:alanyl-tRNA synthetase